MENLNRPPLQTHHLPAELESIAAGLEQQAIVARAGTAMGGMSDPSYFFGQAATLARRAAEVIRKDHPLPPPPPEPVVEQPAPATAASPEPVAAGKKK